MTPFHPKLRKALLLDREHRRLGLTATLLFQYENLLTKLFYEVYYPDQAAPPDRPECFKLTRQSLLDMAKEKSQIPDEVLQKLKPLVGREFHGQDTFLKAVEEALDNENMFASYADLILKHADQTVCSYSAKDISNLQSRGIPGDVLQNLEKVKGHKVRGKNKFIDMLVSAAGTEAVDKYRPVLLEQAVQQDLLEEIKEFRARYLPNYDRILRQWVDSQRKAIAAGYHTLNPLTIAVSSFAILGGWFSNLYRNMKTTLAGLFRKNKSYREIR